jgi:hypothetical protein
MQLAFSKVQQNPKTTDTKAMQLSIVHCQLSIDLCCEGLVIGAEDKGIVISELLYWVAMRSKSIDPHSPKSNKIKKAPTQKQCNWHSQKSSKTQKAPTQKQCNWHSQKSRKPKKHRHKSNAIVNCPLSKVQQNPKNTNTKAMQLSIVHCQKSNKTQKTPTQKQCNYQLSIVKSPTKPKKHQHKSNAIVNCQLSIVN